MQRREEYVQAVATAEYGRHTISHRHLPPWNRAESLQRRVDGDPRPEETTPVEKVEKAAVSGEGFEEESGLLLALAGGAWHGSTRKEEGHSGSKRVTTKPSDRKMHQGLKVSTAT